MSKVKLSKDEKELLDSVESGKFESTLTEARRKELEAAATNTFKKDKRINIRLSSHDLNGIQKKALQKGIPYQALISGLIHQYVEGDIQEKPRVIQAG